MPKIISKKKSKSIVCRYFPQHKTINHLDLTHRDLVSDLLKRLYSAHPLELSRVLIWQLNFEFGSYSCYRYCRWLKPCSKQANRQIAKKTTSLTFHFILRQVNRGPVGEDIWNSAKSLVHEPGGHSTHWHFCEGKATTVSRSSYSLALRSFDKPFATVLDLLGKRNSSK